MGSRADGCINDDLTACQSGVAFGAAGDELADGVNQRRIATSPQMIGNHQADDVPLDLMDQLYF